jgi:hypothetical protein
MPLVFSSLEFEDHTGFWRSACPLESIAVFWTQPDSWRDFGDGDAPEGAIPPNGAAKCGMLIWSA